MQYTTYNSTKPLKGVYESECLITAKTMRIIYKEQLRNQAGRPLDLCSYIMELDGDYSRLETSMVSSLL
jgi:hypothetical protein